MRSNYRTIVVCMPDDEMDQVAVREILERLTPYISSQYPEDEISILAKIEEHPDFDEAIGLDARNLVADIHRNVAMKLPR